MIEQTKSPNQAKCQITQTHVYIWDLLNSKSMQKPAVEMNSKEYLELWNRNPPQPITLHHNNIIWKTYRALVKQGPSCTIVSLLTFMWWLTLVIILYIIGLYYNYFSFENIKSYSIIVLLIVFFLVYHSVYITSTPLDNRRNQFLNPTLFPDQPVEGNLFLTLTAMIMWLFSCTILLTVPKLPLPISPMSWRSSAVKSYTYQIKDIESVISVNGRKGCQSVAYTSRLLATTISRHYFEHTVIVKSCSDYTSQLSYLVRWDF